VRLLVIGGTRNLGPALVTAALDQGHDVTVLNRGVTPDDLPAAVERLRADRRRPSELATALGTRGWDAVVDFACYTGAEAGTAADLLDRRTDHYVLISSGQVYLVRRGVTKPFREGDYPGPLLTAPEAGSDDAEQWRYGIDKRDAEDALAEAWRMRRFPATRLRLPMVHGERDHYGRIAGILARLADGGPIVVPDRPHDPVRHVFAGDVVTAVLRVVTSGLGRGEAYNVGQDETIPFLDFMAMIAASAGRELRLARVDPDALERSGLLPACSPFSIRWMSELDNAKGRRELGLEYTAVETWLPRLVSWYGKHPTPPESYSRRPEELALIHRKE
jgi:nucleoside-diphosphate-sugar epimerase